VIVTSLLENLGTLAQFSGRSSRRAFWPYAICVFILANLAVFLVMIPDFLATFAKIQAYAQAHPENVTVTSGPGHYSVQIHENVPGLMPDMGALTQSISIVMALSAVMLAAAVARRLHDRRKAGWWGLMPLPFAAYSMVAMPKIFETFDRGQPDFTIFFSVFASNAAYLCSMVILIVFLAAPGDPTENRYGEKTQ
jgi:uncharacterized membrane protein YhaH (DUF805 family)